MRACVPGGRFTVDYEIDSYSAGINEDLQRPVGGEVPWWKFDEDATQVDDLYGVASDEEDGGRRYKPHRMLPYIMAQVFQGQTDQSDLGFYNVDNLRISVNMADFNRVFPNIVPEADNFLKDRTVFNGTVFRPTRIYLRGRVLDRYTIITMDLVQVSPEELVNDPQFLWGAEN